MTCAYNELYLNDAKENLALCFDYGITTFGASPDEFAFYFLSTGYAEQFERGNPLVIAGMSGIELAQTIISSVYIDKTLPERVFSEGRSDIYWAGWALAHYQWQTKIRFKDIFSKISLSEIISMYPLYHEMDIENFIDDLNERYYSIDTDTKLKTIRESRGLSQYTLAQLSGVKLRSIQMYEQKVNSIDKAQASTVYKLSRVLGCSVEDLLETPEL